MAYTVPTTAAGQVLTSAIWNASVRDNIIYLQDREDNPPRAELTHNAAQSIANNSDTALTWNTENLDSASLHSTGTNPSRITIPSGQDGFWLFTARVEFAASASGQRRAQFVVNGTVGYGTVTLDTAGSGATHLGPAAIIRVTAGQYVELWVYQNSGGALNVSTGPTWHAIRIA